MHIPPPTHPTWSALLTGKSPVKPDFMAARMFIVRCQMELAKDRSPAALTRLASELRELYAKNCTGPSAVKDLQALFG